MVISEANVHVDTLASQRGLEVEDECEGDVTSMTLDSKAASELMAHAEAIPQVVEDLTKLNQHLGDMFKEHFGLDAILRNYKAPAIYRAFFIQVQLPELHSY
jgi:flagellar biosynthesis/type III secretory pathway chaperone